MDVIPVQVPNIPINSEQFYDAIILSFINKMVEMKAVELKRVSDILIKNQKPLMIGGWAYELHLTSDGHLTIGKVEDNLITIMISDKNKASIYAPTLTATEALSYVVEILIKIENNG